jgi:hypothetical protein
MRIEMILGVEEQADENRSTPGGQAERLWIAKRGEKDPAYIVCVFRGCGLGLPRN